MLLVLPETDSIIFRCRSTSTQTGIAREQHRSLNISVVRPMNFGHEDSAICLLALVMAFVWNTSRMASATACRTTAPPIFRDYQIRSARAVTTAMTIAKIARNRGHRRFAEALLSKSVVAELSRFCLPSGTSQPVVKLFPAKGLQKSATTSAFMVCGGSLC